MFLGKGGSVQDRHTVPAAALIAKTTQILNQLRWKHATWDEIALLTQWQIRGYINYCPLVGIPPHASSTSRKLPCKRLS